MALPSGSDGACASPLGLEQSLSQGGSRYAPRPHPDKLHHDVEATSVRRSVESTGECCLNLVFAAPRGALIAPRPVLVGFESR